MTSPKSSQYNVIKRSKIINTKTMDNQNEASLYLSEISKDSQLLSLFNQCESSQLQPQVPQVQPHPGNIDLHPDTNYNFPGYWSDSDRVQHPYSKSKPIKKLITNKPHTKQQKTRTKAYIQMLQTRILQLQSQNEKLLKLNKINREYIHRLNQSQHHLNGYFVGKQQVFDKLDMLNQQPNSKNQQILQEIVSLRIRQGSYGKDRVKGVNYYWREMVQMLLPDIQKYLLKSAKENSDFFQGSGRHRNLQGWRKKLLQCIEEDQKFDKIRQFLKQNQSKMIEESQKFERMLENFYNQKCSLIEQAKKIQEVFDGAHEHMSPKQLSKTLCFIDKYRFEKNISLERTFDSIFDQVTNENFTYDPTKPFGPVNQ